MGRYCRRRGGVGSGAALNPGLQAIHVDVDDGRGEEREHLAEDEAADDGDAQRTAQLGANAGAERERHGTEKSGHGSHQNRTETQLACLVNRFDGRQSFFPFHLDGEINHEDGVFLDDANQEDDANERDDVEIRFDELNGEQRADSRGRNRGENGDGMNVTFIEDAENDVDGSESGENQDGLIGERILKGLGGPLERSVDRGRDADFAAGLLDVLDSRTERSAGRKIKRERDGRENALVIDGEGGAGWFVVGERAERDELAGF